MDKDLPIPENEPERLKALAKYNILDTHTEEEFERLTKLASIICGVPIALISLMDASRQWFKSKIGLDGTETPRDISFCQYAITGDKLFEVEDATKDKRFVDNPFVTDDPNIRFYAGYPLIDPAGYALGTLCVIDRKARALTKEQQEALQLLAEEVVSQIISRQKKEEKIKLEKEREVWEQNLLLSEEKHRGFFENSQGLMCMHDLEGKFISINPAGAASVGYTVDELKDTSLFDLVPPQTKQLLKGYLHEIEKQGTSKGLMTVIHKNGTEKTWMYNNVLSEGSNGKFVIGTAVDITERITLEKELKESNRRFFKVFDKNPVSMVLSNTETNRIEYVNEVFLETLGFTKEEVIGKTSVDLDIISAEDRERNVFLMKQLGSLRAHENIISKKNGDKLWMLMSLEVVQINEDSFILSSLFNIDERKKMEEEIIRLAESQRAILDGTDYSIITTSEPYGIITSFNKGAEKMLGYSAKEMIGKTPAIIHDPAEVEAKARALSDELGRKIQPGIDVFHIKARQNNISDANEWTYITKDGSRIPVELSITTLRGPDKSVLGYLGIAKDISENKKAKDAIILAKEKAEQAVIAKNSFLANMSHEIRTPMNAILGYTELLAQSELDTEQREHVDFVKTAGTNLLSIINDILDFSKIESGKIALESVPFSLKDTLKSIYNLLKVKAVEKKLDYNFFLDADLPDFVCGDSVRLNQILVNLIGNAIKFTAEGHVTVSVKKLEEQKENYKLKFSVKDSGIGIPENKINEIFERFTQANTETTRKFGGTGLGLSIAKNLVELQGGRMDLKSEIDKGSEFSFEITYKKANSASLEPLQKGFIPKKMIDNIKILLCEDNVLNQKLAKRVIAKFGIEVEIAENGKEGIEKLKQNNYDLVLMDLQMPEMDGYQAVIAIRNELNMSIPIIAMTAHSLVGEKEKCLEIGMNDYIGKPFSQEELYYKICTNLPDIKRNESASPAQNKKMITDTDSHTLDFELLKEFSGGNKTFEKELIELFISHVPADINTLENAFKDANAVLIKSVAHKLRSSMSVVGLKNMDTYLSFIEHNSSTKEMREQSFEKFIALKNILSEKCTLLKKKLIEDY